MQHAAGCSVLVYQTCRLTSWPLVMLWTGLTASATQLQMTGSIGHDLTIFWLSKKISMSQITMATYTFAFGSSSSKSHAMTTVTVKSQWPSLISVLSKCQTFWLLVFDENCSRRVYQFSGRGSKCCSVSYFKGNSTTIVILMCFGGKKITVSCFGIIKC